MNKYLVSFSGTKHNSKPSGREIGKINNELSAREIEYTELAYLVGECGCTFSPAVYNGSRKKENYRSLHHIALDFDNGITYREIKERAERFRLPVLFAYKTFSYTEEHEKFRVVFALNQEITDAYTAEVIIAIMMKMFEECDSACKDISRMFFGGKGIIECADNVTEIAVEDIVISFVEYMNSRYGETHYTRELKRFYNNLGVKYEKAVPIMDDGKFIFEGAAFSVNKTMCREKKGNKRREVTRNFDFGMLYEKCRLYRDFVDGTEYYYYPQLFHIASNLVNAEGGKKEFMHVLNSEVNSDYEAYHKRDWGVILNTIISMDYQPQSCCECPYSDICTHGKNMILTVKPGKSTIIQTEPKSYVSIEEAEQDLKDNFIKALDSDDKGIHIIKAQTGIGKTNLYLSYMKNTDRNFIIAVPTHSLKTEINNKAKAMGITNVACTPELPVFSDDLQEKINHTYDIGAGQYTIGMLRKILHNIGKNDSDYMPLSMYIDELDRLKSFDGHIITTHERLMLMRKNNALLKNRDVIIDEDILRTMLSTHTVSNNDIFNAIQSGLFKDKAALRLREIISHEGYQRYNYDAANKIYADDELLCKLENTSGNILDLVESCYVFRDKNTTTFLKRKWLPCDKVIVMSATSNPDVYRMLTGYDVHCYNCREAEYMGKVKLYSKHSFSRYSLDNQEGVIDYIKRLAGDDTVITFRKYESCFNTSYHYGAVEGLNCLEGKNISVIGLPNINDFVYKLYGMAAGLNPENCNMRPMRTEYNGYSFEINTFDSPKLRTIHLWMLESLIEQAVGRARLLRNNCTVKVFARFPVNQAIVE